MSMAEFWAGASWIVLPLGFLLLYWAPSIIALARKHTNTMPIVVLNLLAGWTLIGWVAAVVWSLYTPQPRTVIVSADAAAQGHLMPGAAAR